jgi:hypothetical protein
MKPDSDEYYCFQWCGRMRWACVCNTTGRDCKRVLARSLGRIVPGRVESWGEYQHKLFFNSIFPDASHCNLTFNQQHL